MAVARTYLDGVEITELVQDGSVTHQLNQPAYAAIRLDLDQVSTSWDGSRLKVVLDGEIDFHGMITHLDDQGDEDTMSRSATFADPTAIFPYRPARDGPASGDPGDFSKPSFTARNTSAPQAVKEILEQSMNAAGIPADAEGPMGISLGTFATGGTNLSGIPTDWPMTIADIIALYVETGELDVVCRPIDAGGNMGEVSAYNGDYGDDRSGSVSFEYKTGAYNATGCRRSRDFSEIMNKLWIYLGPRVSSKKDPQGAQHWERSLTGQELASPALDDAISASRATYFTRMLIRIFDADASSDLVDLYVRWWLMESWLRVKPKTLVHITPQPGTLPTFGVGDKIHVAAGTGFGGGFSGTQRVMQYSYRWDTEGVVQLGEPIGQALAGRPAVETSSDAEMT